MGAPDRAVEPVLILANRRAGRGRAGRAAAALAAALARLGLRCRVVHAESAAAAAAAAGAAEGPVAVVGGDGSVHAAVAGLRDRSGGLGPLAILPRGSGNDFARCCGMPRSPDALARVVRGGAARAVDLGVVEIETAGGAHTSHRFVNNLAVGFEADVNRAARVSTGGGPVRYLAATVRALRRYRPRSLELELDGGAERLQDGLLVSVCNGRRVGGGLRMAPAAELDDGLLDAVWASAPRRRDVAGLLVRLIGGRHLRDARTGIRRVRTAAIHSGTPVPVCADGEELAADARCVTVRVEPGRLLLYRP